MGATATALGRLVLAYWACWKKVAGVVLMVLGLFLSGLWTPSLPAPGPASLPAETASGDMGLLPAGGPVSPWAGRPAPGPS